MALDNPQLSPTSDAAVTPPAYPAAPDISQLLGTDINKVPTFDYSKLTQINRFPETKPEVKKSLQQVQEAQQDLLKREQGVKQLEAEGKAGIEQYGANAQADWAKYQADETRRINQNLEQTKKQWSGFAFHPTQDNAQSLATLFSFMGMIGTALGGRGKMSAMNSMQAMTGMMQGWKQGRQDLWNQEKTKFDEEFKQVQQILADAKDDAQRAMQLLATDRDAYNAYIAQSKAKLGSQLANTILERQGPEAYYKFISDAERGIQEQVKEINKKEQYGQEQNRIDSRLHEHQNFERETELLKLGPALRNISKEYPEGTFEQLIGADVNDKKAVRDNMAILRESEDTADYIARNQKGVGALAKAKAFINLDAIKSIKANESASDQDMAQIATQKSNAIDNELDKAVIAGRISKDDAEAAKLVQKRLFSLALADVRGSGQRGSIYLDKKFQDIYDQASRPRTLLNTIRTRENDANLRLGQYQLNLENNTQKQNYPLFNQGADVLANRYRPQLNAGVGVTQNIVDAFDSRDKLHEGDGLVIKNRVYRVKDGSVVLTNEKP